MNQTRPGVEERRLADGQVRYAVRIRRRGRSAFGVFSTMAEAVAWRAARLADVEAGRPFPTGPRSEDRAGSMGALPHPLTVAKAAREVVIGMVDGQVRTRRGQRFKPGTIRKIESRLRLYVLPRIGRIPVASLRRGDVRRMVDDVAATVSPSAAGLARDALRVVLRRQVELEVIESNVCAGVSAPAPDRRPARFLDATEADALQAAADADDHQAIGPLVALALGTGVRLGEALALRWGPDGLDLERGVVEVRATLDASGPVAPKSGKPRTVPMSRELVIRMRRWRLASGRRDGEPVFLARPRQEWERVRATAGLDGVHFHDLRHTAATFMLAAGLKSHAVAELLGHADAGLVDRLYGHALPDELASAGERLEAWRAATRAATRNPEA
jgi:integrase